MGAGHADGDSGWWRGQALLKGWPGWWDQEVAFGFRLSSGWLQGLCATLQAVP